MRRPWFIAYSVAVLATAVVGVATAPSATRTMRDASEVLTEAKAAAFALSVDNAADTTSSRGFLAASFAFSPAGAKFGHNWYERLADPAGSGDAVGSASFKPAKKPAEALPRKSDRAGKKAKPAPAAAALDVPIPEPLAERFAGSVMPTDPNAPVLLAFADPSPTAVSGVLDAMAERLPGGLAANGPLAQDNALPDEVAIPGARPKADKRKVAEETTEEKPASKKPEPERAAAAKPEIDDSVQAMIPGGETPRGKTTKLAYARPDDPAGNGSGGGFLKGLFRGDNPAKAAGNGVAVYDISAAKVYMPDGSVLEAHSGIGKMADDPRYVHVKMNGPTPPQTYALKMRETRFHGVEAIRMTPIGDKPMHGRTGILAHSFLLRSRLPQSHGCVAFRDYPKFLAAFKAGKVKKMVVVPSGGKRAAVQIAKNGEGV